MQDFTEEKELHLRDYFRVIVKRRYTVYTVFTVIFAVFLIATLSATPLYMATTKVLIEKAEPASLPMTNYYLAYDPDFMETQFQLIKSMSVAQKVVRMLTLDKTYDKIFQGKTTGIDIVGGTIGWFRDAFSVVLNVAGVAKPQKDAGSEHGPEAGETDAKAKMLARLVSGSIVVSPVRNSRIINISYMSPNPELSAAIVNSVAKAYMDEMLEMRMNSSRNAMKWMTEKAEEERMKLERSEKALQEYMRSKDIVTLENRLTMVPEKLSEVGTKIAAAETKRKEMESLYAKVRDVAQNIDNAETIPVIAADPTVQSLRGQILKAEQSITEMSKKYGQKHPAMITAQGDLRVLKEKKNQEIRRVIESIRNEYELAKANEENFRRLATQTKAETLNLSERFIQYGALKREAETNKQLFDAIIKKIKEQDISQDIQTVTIWVIEPAEVPKHPAKPRKGQNILYGLMFGLFGGIGLAFFLEYLDNTIKSPESVEEKLGVPVLGMVRLLQSKEQSMEQIILKGSRSEFAESYKIIRTAILLSSAGTPPKNILITSIFPGEGKTVTSVNLALTIAQAEHSVLLIDSDLRKPRIHKIFGLNNTKGLSSYLAGASDINIIPHVGVPNLNVIPSGPIPPNPSELLGSSKMQSLLKILGERFDIIIWDSAPLLTVTDSLILSKILDGTIIIARAGETTYESVKRGLKSLRDIEAHFLGMVLNGVDIKKGDYYYYRYHSYYTDSTEEKK